MNEIYLCLVTPASLHEADWLTPREAYVLQKIRDPARRRDWLAGRLAAKKLIQDYLLEQAGVRLNLAQIEITHDKHKAPGVTSPLTLPISIAHSAGHGFAALVTHGSIGVDLQEIRPVRPDLAKRVLSEHERKQLTHFFAERELEGLLVFWALKEAAIKSHRTRPAPLLREIAVALMGPGRAEILVQGRIMTAQWGCWKEFIWAWALADQLDDRHAVAALMGRG
ncbi:MAG: 4'-phosphopantetheinyl transferase superfamily protein [Candidatus Bipolaricaulota bacterium]|nr:4'-phosphopantetheinyl transferase superfamily protein [Candidatus Bipolaricaulota bacterium]MDW8030365.1 4'-phosphopantetheinyl transferase superfamily protein [Candidatus Bipolaricaulota bacterium]